MSKRNAPASSAMLETSEGGDSLDPPSSKKSRAGLYGKGNNGQASGSSGANVKVLFEPLQLGGVSNLDELEVKTLKFQNQKLGLRLTQRLAIEEDLKLRIDQLEKRQTQDDAVINVIHRYWNQLNEDMRILLQRFDAETGDEEEKNEESEATTSFLTQLATWHKQELDEKLASRVQVSQRAVGKIIQVFDHVIQRNERLSKAFRGDAKLTETPNGDVTDTSIDKSDVESGSESKTDSKSVTDKVLDESTSASKKDKDKEKADTESTAKTGSKKSAASESASDNSISDNNKACPISCLDDQVKDWNSQLVKENKNLHRLNTSLHEKNHFLSLKQAEFEELINAEQTKNEELQNKLDDLEYELTKSRMRNGKLETVLVDTQEKLRMFMDKDGGSLESKVVLSNSERKTVDQMTQDLEEHRELATNRLAELEQTNTHYKDALKEVERLKMELSTLPEHVVVETTEHKCLQSQFSVLYNEAMQLKTQLEEARNQLQMVKNAHMRQIEQMESEELMTQKKLRTEVIQLEDMLAQVRKEYEMLRIEFEQNLAANEQTGPINKEMRNLIQSLQTHNVQLKGEVARYKRKGKEANLEIVKLRKDLEDMKNAEIKALQVKKELMLKANVASEAAESLQMANNISANLDSNSQDSGSSPNSAEAGSLLHNHQTQDSNLDVKSGNGSDNIGENETDTTADESSNGPIKIKSEPNADGDGESGSDVPIKDEPSDVDGIKSEVKSGSTPTTPITMTSNTPIKKELLVKVEPKELKEKIDELQRQRAKDGEVMKDLRKQLKDAQKDVREMKLLLDMFKTLPKEQRDKAQLMAAEKKVKAELDDSRNELKRVREAKKEEKKRLADEDAQRRIRQLEETCSTLQKQVANHKQEEEALLSEMEVTGQAFEDMQEQNSRLIQQLREKDDANFKLMSERIKSNQIQRLAREERDMLTQQVNTLSTQVEAQNQVVRKLEEKERLLQTNLAALDKELSMRQQAMEMHKRKAIESAQSAADLKLHLEKYHAQIKEMQVTVAEKTSSLEAEAFKTKRLQEELVLVKRKVERLRKIEMASDMDEILKEEIREYKETLTCPSCKVKRKDAVLTKCFHCFCYDCLRTRYETRQRKCPKCNAAFGASDYHRLYLA